MPSRSKVVFDFLRHVVPTATLAVGRLEVVVDVLKVDVDLAAPTRHRLVLEDFERAEAEVAHPGRLFLHLRDLRDDLAIQAALRLEYLFRGRAKVVFVDLADFRFVDGEIEVGGHACFSASSGD